jgi:amino acid transporter
MIVPNTIDTSPEATHVRGAESWDFAGWGEAERIADLPDSVTHISHLDQPIKHLLGTWKATALCGNDITSSVLYVAALAVAQAGVLAPVVLLMVAAVLYVYRSVYAEVGSALPLNGGTYTVLLNTTRKSIAASAASLTLLSYVATAVISASESMHYATAFAPHLNVTIATIVVLSLFALLNIIGVSESAGVALVIFVTHIVTLTLLVGFGTAAVLRDHSLLTANFAMPRANSLLHSLVFGFAAAMLGISGFESSANFIEEQAEGVFPKTLRNMWVAVAFFNPVISILALGLLPLVFIQGVPSNLLAEMGRHAGGSWLATLVSADAVFVLSGAVLTSFVGTTGLVRRMSLDRCLPQVLLRENRWRSTNHWIILGFLALCVSILLMTGGNLVRLASVYALAFLSVMALFAVGNLLLKHKRKRLPRSVRTPTPVVVVALVAVLVALVGNVLFDLSNVVIFLIYFASTMVVIGVMLWRLDLLKFVLTASGWLVESFTRINGALRAIISRQIRAVNSLVVVYFTRGDNFEVLNVAARYVLRNEQTNRLKVVHVYHDEDDIPPDLARQLATLDRMYPALRIDFLVVRGTFGPSIIERLSQRLDVPKNMMFIGTPSDKFPHRIEELGGVRVIL